MSRRKRQSRHKGGSGKAHVRAGQRHHSPDDLRSQVFTSIDALGHALHNSGRLAVVFQLTASGRIGDQATILHGAEPIGIVPVPMLTIVADQLPSLDTPELRQSIATYHAEQAGMVGVG